MARNHLVSHGRLGDSYVLEFADVTQRKQYTKKERARALRLHKKGWGYARISKEIGCFPSTVKKWVDASGQTKNPGPRHSDEKRKAAIAYYKDNVVSIRAAADEAGISPKTMARWLSEATVATRAWSKVGRKGIVEDLLMGMSKKDIAKKYSCSESWVYRVERGG